MLVLAPARSLSTIVTAMLGSHPELYGFPELTLFEHPTVGARLDAPRHPSPLKEPPPWNPVEGLERAVAQLHEGIQDDDAVARARAWLEDRRDWSGADVFDHLLALVAPRCGVEKSPGTCKRDETLERAAAAYPHARFVHLTRHPVATAASLRHEYWLYGREWACVRSWVDYHRRIAAFCASLPAGRTLRVRGEDVLNDGRGELRRIAAWLGVRTDDAAVDAMLAPERSPFAGFGPRSAPGGGDGAFFADPVPRTVELPAAMPSTWNVPPELRTESAALALELGY